MPEGPEIRRAADRLAAALTGAVIEEAWFRFPRLEPWATHLEGHPIRAVEARGKAMLIRSAAGITIYSHNQLYGRWYTRRRSSGPPKTTRDLRLSLLSARSAAYLYSASDIFVMMDEDVDALPAVAKLGPDLLDEAVDEAVVRSRIDAPRYQRRGLGGLYLDQGFLCGPGNYLRSEILFVAGLHPRRRPGELDEEERQRLARATLEIPRRSYQTGGITTAAPLAAALKAKGWSRSRLRHYVFARAGKPCHRCGETVLRERLSSRRVYICPGCQPRNG